MSVTARGTQRPARVDPARDQASANQPLVVGVWEPRIEWAGWAAQSADADTGPAGTARSLPYWDANAYELWMDDALVKRYRQDAPSQWRILAVFQEEGWPPSIDDPLPGSPDHDPKERLHHTVRNVNRGNNCIHFGVSGSGERVFWRRAGPG